MKYPKGYEIVCPDGKVRNHPYINRGDAEGDARDETRHHCMKPYRGQPKAWLAPPCPQGKHTIRRQR
jgi:hypothetical protein